MIIFNISVVFVKEAEMAGKVQAIFTKFTPCLTSALQSPVEGHVGREQLGHCVFLLLGCFGEMAF